MDKRFSYFLCNKSLNLKAKLDKQQAYQNAVFVIITTLTDCDAETNYFNTKNVEAVIEDVIDDYNPEGLCIGVNFSMPSQNVIRSLEKVIEWRGKSTVIRCDNAPENISQVLIDWANTQQITLKYIQLGKPTQNAYVERFNRTVRHEWLELHLFESVIQASCLPRNDLGHIITNGLAQQLVACRQDIC